MAENQSTDKQTKTISPRERARQKIYEGLREVHASQYLAKMLFDEILDEIYKYQECTLDFND